MKVHLYTLCWNEADILGFFFRHYDPWVDRYVVFDDGSTDGSLEILRAHPRTEIRRFERTHADSFVLSHQHMHNECWKQSRGQADWVVITAVDEHLQANRSDNRDYLATCIELGVTLVPAIGFEMVSKEFPDPAVRLASSCLRGAPSQFMNKLSIFNPGEIDDTGFETGRHAARPSGRLVLAPRDDMMLLHYKRLGFARSFARNQFLKSGLGPRDLKTGWGRQYAYEREEFTAKWQQLERSAVDIGAPGFDPALSARERWWRPTDFVDASEVPKSFRTRVEQGGTT